MPNEPYEYLSGAAFTRATNCFRSLAGTSLLASKINPVRPVMPMGSKLLTGSYGSLARTAGLTVKVVPELISSV